MARAQQTPKDIIAEIKACTRRRYRLERGLVVAIRPNTPALKADLKAAGGDKAMAAAIRAAADPADFSRSWGIEWKEGGVSRYIGGGSLDTMTLAQAYKWLDRVRGIKADGGDPVKVRDEKRAALAVKRQGKAARTVQKSFKALAEEYVRIHGNEWEGDPKTWARSMKKWVYPKLGAMDVGKIERADVLKVLNQKVEVDGATATFWLAHPVTASRVRGRLSKVLALGKARELRSGPNPATWDDDMEIELSKRPFPEFHPTLGYPRTPEFFQTLRNGKHVDKPKEAPREWWAGKMPALVLAFTIASCLRVGEVTSMTVGNLDRKNRIATVKVKRKGKQKKRIPYHTMTLTPLMSKILDEAEALRGDSGLDPKAFVFPGERSKSRMRQFVVGRLSKQILPDNPTLTVHGFRSAFRDFAGNKLSFDSEVCEFCLAHVLAGTEAAYRREDAPEKRRKLMEIWNHYLLTGVIKANVVELAA